MRSSSLTRTDRCIVLLWLAIKPHHFPIFNLHADLLRYNCISLGLLIILTGLSHECYFIGVEWLDYHLAMEGYNLFPTVVAVQRLLFYFGALVFELMGHHFSIDAVVMVASEHLG